MEIFMLRESLYYESLGGGSVQCTLCPYMCSINPSRRGQCGVRVNRNGKLYSQIYARVSTQEVVAIEELPLYHFHPGAQVMLVGSQGCNMQCPFCSTWRVSQTGARTRPVSPESLVDEAQRAGVKGVAFGVNEPVVWFEYIVKVAPLLKQAGFFVVAGTNGLISQPALCEILSHIDAIIVDIKGWDNNFYNNVCGGFRDEVLRNIMAIANTDCHLELSTIIIAGKNDDEAGLENLFKWVANLKPPPPLHLVQYQPAFQYNFRPTDPVRMFYLQEKARRILPYVYLSNMDEREANTTYCPTCHSPLIIREAGKMLRRYLDNAQCTMCGVEIPLVE